MFHWLQRVRHFKPVLVAQRWLNLFQGYPIPQGLSTQSRPEGRGLNPTFLVTAETPSASPGTHPPFQEPWGSTPGLQESLDLPLLWQLRACRMKAFCLKRSCPVQGLQQVITEGPGLTRVQG